AVCKHGGLQAGQVSQQGRQPFIPPFRPALLDHDVATLDEAGLSQAAAKRSHDVLERCRGGVAQEADDGHRRLLRARRERPRRRAAEQRDELATCSHSITSSAVASSLSGTAKSSISAAWRLITS